MSRVNSSESNDDYMVHNEKSYTQKDVLSNQMYICSISDCNFECNQNFVFTNKKSDSSKSTKCMTSTNTEKKDENSRFVTSNCNTGQQFSSYMHIHSNLSVQGHTFIRRTLHKPAYCHHCGEVIWGLLSTGFQCEG